MSKEQKSIKAGKKAPAMTPKEKKAAKKAKKDSKGSFAISQMGLIRFVCGRR